MRDPDLQSVPQQLVATFRQFSTLVQDELQLARAEIKRNISRAGGGLALLCVAALLGLVALNLLATALVGVLTAAGVPFWLSSLVIAGVLFLTAMLLIAIGKARLDPDALAPSRTIANVKKDFQELKEASHG